MSDHTYDDFNIFVFGSNLAGRHGRGAAKFALDNCGAKYGVGVGLTGYSYGIPTKDENIQSLPLSSIETYVCDFIDYAKLHPEVTFWVTKVGCGLAGYTDDQIAPMFSGAPDNCLLPKGWDPDPRAPISFDI